MCLLKYGSHNNRRTWRLLHSIRQTTCIYTLILELRSTHFRAVAMSSDSSIVMSVENEE